MTNGRPWTNAEDQLLRDLPKHPASARSEAIKKASEDLKRTIWGILSRLRYLRLDGGRTLLPKEKKERKKHQVSVKPQYPVRDWTDEEDEIVKRYYSNMEEHISNREYLDTLSKQIERSKSAIMARAHRLGLNPVVEEEELSEYDDDNFKEAMLRAYRAGLETPPMIGVDTRPCTKNPQYMARRVSTNLRSLTGNLEYEK